jgi:hypothetical protein
MNGPGKSEQEQTCLSPFGDLERSARSAVRFFFGIAQRKSLAKRKASCWGRGMKTRLPAPENQKEKRTASAMNKK